MARRSQRAARPCSRSLLPLALLCLLASPAVHQCTAGRALRQSSGLGDVAKGSNGGGGSGASGPPGGSDPAVNATSNQTAPPPSPQPLRGAELLKQASVALGLVELANGEPGRATSGGGGGATGQPQPSNGSQAATGGEQAAQPTAVGATGPTGAQQHANSSAAQLAAGNGSAVPAANSSDSVPAGAQQQQP